MYVRPIDEDSCVWYGYFCPRPVPLTKARERTQTNIAMDLSHSFSDPYLKSYHPTVIHSQCMRLVNLNMTTLIIYHKNVGNTYKFINRRYPNDIAKCGLQGRIKNIVFNRFILTF